MSRSIAMLVLVAAITGAPGAVPAALAQGNPPGTVTVSSALTGIHQLTADFDGGGDLQWSSGAVSAGVTRQFVPAFAAGLALRYDYEDWTIRPGTVFAGEALWQHLQRPGATLNLSLALSRTLVVGLSPTIEWAYDSRASAGDALIYGAVVSAAKVFSPQFTLGAGASVTRQFYSVKTSSFVIVSWKLTDRLRIANAPSASPLGGAGVELRYAPAPDWEVAAGGVYRSDRWRLVDRAPSAGRVGETSFIPMLGRLSRQLGPRARVDLYGGATFANRITLRDSDGRELAHDGYGVTPLLSAALSARF